MKLTLGQIADWMHAEGDFPEDSIAQGYSIDTRTIAAGELFFAVKGERLDGHDYVETALVNGALAAVVSQRWLAPASVDAAKLMRVPDHDGCGVLDSLQKLARAVRRRWGRRVIGVTGSVGKTTTKEAVAQVLSARFNVLKSQGNLNNAFGLPLQLLKLEPEHEIAVMEMGMNHAGEITALAKIAEPDWAVVTNVAPVHLEHFADGIDGIARAKYELVQALSPDGIAILNCDDEHVAKFGAGMGERAVFYGLGECARVRGSSIVEAGADGIEFTASETIQDDGGFIEVGSRVHLHFLGRHNVHNALAAIGAGFAAGIPIAESALALNELRPGDKRGEIVDWHGAKIINDCYNSNPKALDAMVDALLAMPTKGRHIVVAGEMLELGPEGKALHRTCGRRMESHGVDIIVGVRGLAGALVEGAKKSGANAIFVETPEEAGAWLRENLRAGDAVLLKASRGVRLERALTVLAD